MITACAKAYQVLGNAEHLAAAQASARFLREKLWQNGKLLRRYRDGDSRFRATAEDYAYLIQGLLHLYESDFDIAWLDWARELQKQQDDLLWDKQGSGYFTAEATDTTLFLRKKDANDGAVPSPNSVAAFNLLRLHHLTYEAAYLERAMRVMAFLSPVFSRYPAGACQGLQALEFATERVKAIAVAGDRHSENTLALVREVWRAFLPNRVIAAGHPGGVPLLEGKRFFDGTSLAYVCYERTCQEPTSDLAVLREQLK